MKKKNCDDADYAGPCDEGLEECKKSFKEYLPQAEKGWAFCDYGTQEEVEAIEERGEESKGNYLCYYCFNPEKQPPELPAAPVEAIEQVQDLS